MITNNINADNSNELYRLTNISRHYPAGKQPIKALDSVSISVQKNDFLAVTGPSGSGKSTLMNILGLLDSPSSGSLAFCQQNVSELHHGEIATLRNKSIGFIFQLFQLLARTTALENVELPLLYSACPKTQRRELAACALEKVGLAHRLHHMPTALSGGEQQRVAIARAIVNNPAVILADEPTGALDTVSSEIILDLLRELNEQGTTVIIITHSMSVAQAARQRIDIIDGKIVAPGSSEWIFPTTQA